ncbi:unnamed protein product [Rhodiola kirilowii]
MELLPRNAALLSLTLTILLPAALVLSHTQFAPADNYLINCGSAVPTTLHHDNRLFLGDQVTHSSFRLKSSRTSSLADPNFNPNLSPIYFSTRVFDSASTYRFSIKEKGTHIIRLHFNRRSEFVDRERPLFRVYAGGFLLIGHGVESSPSTAIKEFFVPVNGDQLEIRFVPMKGSLAYVSAIEVISAPRDLIADAVKMVGTALVGPIIGRPTRRALENVYRVNVGGPKVTPFNDSLWRTWLPDDGYLASKVDDSIKRVYSSGPIRYRTGGASHEVGPDNMYNTARVITSEKRTSIPNLNITWTFPVVEGYQYLVRLHFCDIASVALGLLHFNVYVNGNLALENLDLSRLTDESLASPYYADFLVNVCGSNAVSVSVGPSIMSRLHSVDAILNGIEIMKMSNTMKSLGGDFGMDGNGSVTGSICDSLLLVVVICLLVLISMVIKRRLGTLKDSGVWARLSLGGSDAGVKYSNIPLADKI